MTVEAFAEREKPKRSGWRFVIGTLLLAVCLGAAAALAFQHLGRLELPGCRPGSGCAALSAGRWGSLWGWPVAYLGTAWFAGMLAAWFWAGWRGGLSPWLKWAVRAGAAGSVVFTGLMLLEGHVCPYCVAVHIGNLLFWGLVELTRRDADAPLLVPILLGGTAAVAVSVILATTEVRVRDRAAQELERTFQRSLEEVVARLKSSGSDRAPTGLEPLRGRHRWGPEQASIRLVIFSDYQCEDCWNMEAQLAEVLPNRPDVTLFHRHYPLCAECNPAVKWKHMHPNACRAARAAEAAAIAGGEEAFWKLHHWLFERKGDFSDEQLATALPQLGIEDREAFFRLMDSEEVRRRVEEDLALGSQLEIPGTPAVFVNGLLVEGTDTPGSIRRLVEAVAALKLPVRGPERDFPDPGLERLVRLWKTGSRVDIPQGPSARIQGDPAFRHRFVFWVDYQSPYTPQVNRSVQAVLRQRKDILLEVRLFPVSREHNPRFKEMSKELLPKSWEMACFAEAAAQLGGSEAFRRIHEWLLEHQEDFELEAALKEAAAAGLDPEKLTQVMKGEAVLEALRRDMQTGIDIDLGFPPRLYLDGRPVHTNTTQLEQLLRRLLTESDGR